MKYSRQKQVFFVGSVCILAAALLLVFKSGVFSKPSPSMKDPAVVEMLPASPNQFLQQAKAMAKVDAALANAEKILLAEKKKSPEVRVNEVAGSKTGAEAEVVDGEIPWQVTSPDDIYRPTIPLNTSVKAFSVIKINPRPLKFPSEGEKMTLPMFDGRALTANVESVQTSVNGDRTWIGHLDGLSDDFPVVMTYGESLTFATINTPDGNYSLEAKDGVGWLYKNPTVAELFGPDSVDLLVPDQVNL